MMRGLTQIVCTDNRDAETRRRNAMSQQMLEKDVEPKKIKNKKLDRQTALFSVRAQIA